MPGIDRPEERPTAEAPRDLHKDADAKAADRGQRVYDPLEHVERTPTPRSDTPAAAEGEDRQLGGLVHKLRQSFQDRFPTSRATDAPSRVTVDQPELPRTTHAVYGRPTISDSSGHQRTPPLFDGPPRRDQVRQGDLGDCWAIAAISAVAGHRPDALRDVIREKSDGSYEVRLHHVVRHDQTGHWIPTRKRVEMEITPELPVDPDEPSVAAFANTHRSGVSWVAILEKALAGLDHTTSQGHPQGVETGYDRLNRSGTAGDTAHVLAQLTGERAGIVRIDTTSSTAFDQTVRGLLRDGKPVVVGTSSDDSRHGRMPYGLSAPHAYDVVANDEGILTLRNPSGILHPPPIESWKLMAMLDGSISTLVR